MASRYGRNQKQAHITQINDLEQKLKARNKTIESLSGSLAAANAAIKALAENTPEDEWAIILGGLNDPEARKLLAYYQRNKKFPPQITYEWSGKAAEFVKVPIIIIPPPPSYQC